MPTTITGDTGVSQVQAGATSDGLPVFQCRAWVNFDGTRDSTGAASTANTARFIRASGNVSSVVRNGTGDYTVNFTNAMPDVNYAVTCGGQIDESGTAYSTIGVARVAGAQQTTSVRVGGAAIGSSPSALDFRQVNIAIFR